MTRWYVGLVVLTSLALGGLSGCGCRRDRPAVGQTPAPVAPPNRLVHVLCYHNLADKPANLYDTSLADFKAQMAALKTAGFTSITCTQLADYLAAGKDLPAKSVLITFDDGRKSVLTAAKPVLHSFGFKANLFLITASVGSKGTLTWAEIKDLQAAGYEIGSHTADHSNLTRRGKSESLSQHQERVRRELDRSFATLEQRLGAPPAALAYPYGNYDGFVMAAARDAGYRVAFSIDPGVVDQQSSPWALPRKMIVNGTSLATFHRVLATEPLHLSQVDPAVGARVGGRQYRLTARVSDPDALTGVTAEVGKGTKTQVDPTTSLLTVTATLNKGANLVRLSAPGPPRREAGWIVVCDP